MCSLGAAEACYCTVNVAPPMALVVCPCPATLFASTGAPAGTVNVSAASAVKMPLELALAVPRRVRGSSHQILTVSNDPKPTPRAATVLPTAPVFGLNISRGLTEKSAAPQFAAALADAEEQPVAVRAERIASRGRE